MTRKTKPARQLLLWSIMLAFFVTSGWVQPSLGWSAERQILLISDIHFDPFQDETIVQELIDTTYWNWYRIFSTSRLKKPSALGSETNYALLSSTLKRMKKVCPNPDFILFSGDVLAHDFDSKFLNYSKSKREYQAFVLKTLKFVGSEISQSFPQIPTYFTLGNNDQFDGDYDIPPDGAFLHSAADMFYRIWLKGEVEDQPRFVETFAIRGNYVIRPQDLSNTRIISLNSIYFSSRNNYRQQGWLQLKWIEGQLAAAQKKAERVWIVTHIPPGVDVYSTLHSPGNVMTYWDESTRNEEGRTYLQQFQYLMRQYASVIKGVFSGHSHMDHFRLVPGEGNDPGGVAFVHVTPAVSPQFDNNAAFELLRYDDKTLNALDYETHYFDQGLGEWEREYDFGEIYRKPAMTPSDLWGVQESLEKNRAVRSMFINFYDVNNPDSVPIDRSNWKAYWCAISELTPAAFSACYP